MRKHCRIGLVSLVRIEYDSIEENRRYSLHSELKKIVAIGSLSACFKKLAHNLNARLTSFLDSGLIMSEAGKSGSIGGPF